MKQTGQAGEYRHKPVLLRETLEDFAPLFDREGPVRILDGTLGLGGHSEALLETYPRCEILGLDRDPEALALASTRLARFGSRFGFVHSRFSRFEESLASRGWEKIDGALLDIGVSSLQLDEELRGFSVYGDGPLDMRMDASCSERSAWQIVNHSDFKSLRDLIATYGEDPQAGRIAKAICQARQIEPVETTHQLAEIVSRAYPPAWRAKSRHHPATRTFQALRMAVNDELGELKIFLDTILSRLSLGGRLVVISFHSLEDRLVKQSMRHWSEGCLCSKFAPVCTCHHVPEVTILHKKPLTAGEVELAENPRAASAKLRCVEKIALHRDDRQFDSESRVGVGSVMSGEGSDSSSKPFPPKRITGCGGTL